MAHIAIVTCVFPPEPVVSARTSQEIALRLAAMGHRVTVITAFPSRPAGRVFSGYRRKLVWDSVEFPPLRLIRCYSMVSRRSTMLSRMMENVSFGAVSAAVASRLSECDVIYANTWPLVATGFLAGVAAAKRIPLVLTVQDAYPESLIVQNRLRLGSLAERILRALDRRVARQASRLIVISRRFADLYTGDRHVPPERVSVVPNWMGEETSANTDLGRRLRCGIGASEDSLVAVYSGNVGTAAGLRTVLSAYALLREEPNIRLLIAGEGADLKACLRFAEKEGLAAVAFHAPYPQTDAPAVLGSANIFILPTQGAQSSVSVPSKLLTYMGAGRPVLASALEDSEIGSIIADSGAGWVVRPDDAPAMAAKLREISSMDAGALARMGELGKRYARKCFDRESALEKVTSIVLSQASRTEMLRNAHAA